MAYVQPRRAPHDLGALLRVGTRTLAVAAYTTALAVALLLLAPVLFAGGSGVPAPPPGPEPLTYTPAPGDTPARIAAVSGLSQARLYALNPRMGPLEAPSGRPIVVGFR